jgi:hypothetical protein
MGSKGRANVKHNSNRQNAAPSENEGVSMAASFEESRRLCKESQELRREGQELRSALQALLADSQQIRLQAATLKRQIQRTLETL